MQGLINLSQMALWTGRTRNSLRRLHQRGVLKPVDREKRWPHGFLYRAQDYKHLVLPLTEEEQRDVAEEAA